MHRRKLLSFLGIAATAGCAEFAGQSTEQEPRTKVVTRTVIKSPTARRTTPSPGESPTSTPTETETFPTPSPTPVETPTPTPTTSPTATPTPTPPSDPVERTEWYLNRAGAHFRTAVSSIPSTRGTFEEVGTRYDFDSTPVMTALSKARDDLQQAQSTPANPSSGGQKVIIQALGEYHEAFPKLLAVIQQIRTIHDTVGTGASEFAQGQYADAAGTYEEASEAATDMRADFKTVSDTISDVASTVDAERFGLDILRPKVEDIRMTTLGVEVLSKGGHGNAAGWAGLTAGREQYGDGNYDDAKANFKQAIESFKAANDWYSRGEQRETIAMRDRITQKICPVTNALKASQHYRAAAQAALANDFEKAEARKNEAEKILEKSCS